MNDYIAIKYENGGLRMAFQPRATRALALQDAENRGEGWSVIDLNKALEWRNALMVAANKKLRQLLYKARRKRLASCQDFDPKMVVSTRIVGRWIGSVEHEVLTRDGPCRGQDVVDWVSPNHYGYRNVPEIVHKGQAFRFIEHTS